MSYNDETVRHSGVFASMHSTREVIHDNACKTIHGKNTRCWLGPV